MKTHLDMNRIAKGLGAERRGKSSAKGGYFGALQLLADIQARFRVPAGGGRLTDPLWTERRLVPLAFKTLVRLEELTAKIREHSHVNIEPMQLAGLLLGKTTEQLSAEDAEEFVRPRSAGQHARSITTGTKAEVTGPAERISKRAGGGRRKK